MCADGNQDAPIQDESALGELVSVVDMMISEANELVQPQLFDVDHGKQIVAIQGKIFKRCAHYKT